MEWSEFLNTDTVQLTVIPGILVLLVLIFWFKRSGKKHKKVREFGRAPNSRHDNLDWATAVAEAGQDVRLGQSYDLDVLGDEELAVAPAKSGQHDKLEQTISDVEDEALYAPRMKYSRRDSIDDIDFLDEVELLYKEVKASTDEHKTQPSGNIVYSYEEDIPEAAETQQIAAEEIAEPEVEPTPTETRRPEKPELLLVLNVVGGNGRQLRGSAVLKALTATGLTFGAMNIFHFYHPNRPGKAMFSIASMIEPGSFTLATMDELTTPGLTLFANVPRPEDGINTFTVMLETAKKLAEILDAEVCDERRGTLSKQGIEHIHGQIREHQRRSRLAHAARA
jgi:cell division protein ZipA